MKGGFFKNFMVSKEERIGDALGFYEQALNFYKLAKNWIECANVNLEMAKLAQVDKDINRQASFLSEAGNFFLKD